VSGAPRPARRRRLAALALGVAVVLAGCASSSAPRPAPESPRRAAVAIASTEAPRRADAPTGPEQTPPQLVGRVVREVRVQAPGEVFRSEAERRYVRELLGLPDGSQLTRQVLRDGIEAVYRTGRWRQVTVEGTAVGDDGVALRLVLEPVERVGILRFEGPRVVTRGELDNVIQLRAGQEFRQETVARATRVVQDFLDRVGYPDAVVVATSRPFGEAFEREVTIGITPNEPCRLTEVRLEGWDQAAHPDIDLYERLGLRAGDVCDRRAIDAGIDRVRERLRSAGYLEASLSQPRVAYASERRTAALSVEVRPGPRAEIVFELVRPSREVYRVTCGKRPDRADNWVSRTGVRIARIASPRCRRYDRLLDALSLGDQPDLSQEGLSVLADRLVARYRQDAHPWVSVGLRTEPLPDGRRLVFRIDEGPATFVRGVEFRGNPQIDRDRLLEQMVTRPRSGPRGILSEGVFLQNEFEEDLEAIRTFYRQEGFLDVQIPDVDFRFGGDRSDMWITVTIDEGPRYVLTAVDVEGADPLPGGRLKDLPIRAGQPFSLAAVDRAVEWLTEALASEGYLTPSVEPDVRLETSPPSARVRLAMTSGPRTLVGKVIYRGNFYTRTRVLAREMAVRTGEPYDPAQILESQRNIGRVGFLRNVSVRPAEEVPGAAAGAVVPAPGPSPRASPDPGVAPEAAGGVPAPLAPTGAPSPGATPSPPPAPSPAVSPSPAAQGPLARDILVSVEEANRVDLSFGFDYSLEERLRAFGDVSFRNLFGTDRSVTLRGLAGDRESLYGLEYRQPYLFDVLLNGRIGLTYQDRDEENFSFRRTALITSVQRSVRRSLRVSLDYELESTEVFDVAPGTVLDPRDDVGTIQIGAIRPVLVWDLRDDPFNPTGGFFSTLTVEVANQTFLSEAEFVRVVAGSSWFQPLERTRRLVFALSLRGGYAVAYGASNEVPLIRRFFLGGATTVRGFDRDEISPEGPDGSPTGGDIYLNENAELRFPLPFGFGGAVFLDAGQVWLDERDVDVFDQRASYGVGLRYVTPVGPIRLDYGRKFDRQRGETAGEFHFSIGYVF
jgi:outer membrane protein insertion porin family